MSTTVDYFMGALTGHGFVNLFDRLYDENASRVVLLKGGAGTGKSTLLKRIAAAAEEEEGTVERIHCSSDPSSLDAVCFGDGKYCVLDATAPHAMDPRWPGAVDSIVNLGDHWNEEMLQNAKPKIAELMKRKRKIYEEVYRCLEAASDACRQRRQISEQFIRYEKMNASVLRLAESAFPPKEEKAAKEEKRILYAVTPQGYTGLESTLPALAKHITVLRDEHGIADLYLHKLRASLLENGYAIVSCLDTLTDGLDALIVPEIGRAFVVSSFLHEYGGKPSDTIAMKQFVSVTELRSYKARLAFHRKLCTEMLRTVTDKLGEITQLHRMLEGIYGAAMDFDAVNRTSDALLASFGLS